MITYQLNEIPFSYVGSFLTISLWNGASGHRLAYKTCSGRAVSTKDQPFWAHDFFEIALYRDGQEVPYTYTAQPHRLDLHAQDATATLVFLDQETVLFEVKGAVLHLLPYKPFATEHRPTPSHIVLYDHLARGVHQIRADVGTNVHVTSGPLVNQQPGYESRVFAFGDGQRARGAFRFRRYVSQWSEPLPSLEAALKASEEAFTSWMAGLPNVPDRYREAAELAWFIMWSCQVSAGAQLTRPAIYMSKFWMSAIWAWDNCFNALSVARANPELAWDQLRLFFDHQSPEGMIPDVITDLDAIHGFMKPPIYGWAIRKLVDRLGLEASIPALRELYNPLCRLTEWWYTFRDSDGDGLCEYHNGNDSGWDNATVFDYGVPVEGADLAAHLALQTEVLGFIAEVLGKTDEAQMWRERSSRQIDALLAHSLRDNRFVSPVEGKDTPESYSLLNYVPLELGTRLPADVRNTLLADLAPEGSFLTSYGLASESPASPKYDPDGYWRGPIWAPSTYLIFDGMVQAGATDLARIVAERFCDMCVQDPGFWENYDAQTGKGLRCPGYSWTAAVFLLLAEWLAEHSSTT